MAHNAGERPTAAFPSSHVGITTVVMLLAHHAHCRKLVLGMLPFYILMCLSTVYILAHYAIDALTGLFTGVVLYFVLIRLSKRFTWHKSIPKRNFLAEIFGRLRIISYLCKRLQRHTQTAGQRMQHRTQTFRSENADIVKTGILWRKDESEFFFFLHLKTLNDR